MNTAAQLIVGAKKQDHIKHVLRDRLHWLPVPQRVQFKLCLLTYKALHGLAPSSIADLCRPVTTIGSRQTPIRYSWRPCSLLLCHTLWHPCIRCGRSQTWNQLPMHIRALVTVSWFKMAPSWLSPNCPGTLRSSRRKCYLWDQSWDCQRCCMCPMCEGEGEAWNIWMNEGEWGMGR